jgi:hypothetical protein
MTARKIVKTYDYVDESSKLLYQNCRLAPTETNPKPFSQRRPGNNGEYISNLKGINRTLYRLPELIESSKQVWTFLCEGEKDTDRLNDMGLTATTSGSSTSWKPEFRKYFAGRLVCILPDFDAAGLKYAITAADSLYGAASEVRILHLPDLDEGEDVSDWLNNGGTKKKLLELVDQTKPYKPKPEKQIPYVILSSVESQKIEYLIPEIIPLGMITSLVSQEGEGKSTLASNITAHITVGRTWPYAPNEPNPKAHVIIFSHEEDISRVLKPRLIANGADLERVIAGESFVKIKGGKEESFSIEHNVPELDALIEEFPETRLIIFDPITSYSTCNENSNSEVRKALKPLVDLAARRNVAVLALTHLNKKIDLGMINRTIGSRAWSAVPCIIWGIRTEQVEDEDGSKIDTDNCFLANIKCNIGPKPRAFKFSIGEGGKVTWSEERIVMSLDNDNRVKTNQTEKAVKWLKEFLRSGVMTSTAIFEAGKQEGFSERVLNLAKDKLKIKPDRIGFGRGGGWWWELPND